MDVDTTDKEMLLIGLIIFDWFPNEIAFKQKKIGLMPS